jgi:hypothetical protein
MLRRWLQHRLAEYLQQHTQKVTATADIDKDGMTFIAEFTSPGVLSSLRGVLRGGSMKPTGDGLPKGMPQTHIEVVPGFQRG